MCKVLAYFGDLARFAKDLVHKSLDLVRFAGCLVRFAGNLLKFLQYFYAFELAGVIGVEVLAVDFKFHVREKFTRYLVHH